MTHAQDNQSPVKRQRNHRTPSEDAVIVYLREQPGQQATLREIALGTGLSKGTVQLASQSLSDSKKPEWISVVDGKKTGGRPENIYGLMPGASDREVQRDTGGAELMMKRAELRVLVQLGNLYPKDPSTSEALLAAQTTLRAYIFKRAISRLHRKGLIEERLVAHNEVMASATEGRRSGWVHDQSNNWSWVLSPGVLPPEDLPDGMDFDPHAYPCFVSAASADEAQVQRRAMIIFAWLGETHASAPAQTIQVCTATPEHLTLPCLRRLCERNLAIRTPAESAQQLDTWRIAPGSCPPSLTDALDETKALSLTAQPLPTLSRAQISSIRKATGDPHRDPNLVVSPILSPMTKTSG